MGQIKVTNCIKDNKKFEGLYIIEPTVHKDSRGYFVETYNERDFKEAGFDVRFVQDNESSSARGVLRGLHYQRKYSQGKLVRVLEGRVYDVALDIRKDSETFGMWYGVELSEENKLQFFIPEGFAHGFLVLSKTAKFAYKVTDFYHPGDEGGINYNDPLIAVKWPVTDDMELILSEKDKKWPGFHEALKFS